MSDGVSIPSGKYGAAINKVNDLATRLGAPKSVTGVTQALADAVPSAFVHQAFDSATTVLKSAALGDVMFFLVFFFSFLFSIIGSWRREGARRNGFR